MESGIARVLVLVSMVIALACGRAGVSASDLVQVGLEAEEKQENAEIKQMVDKGLADAERRQRAQANTDAACRHISELGDGIQAGTVSWSDVLRTSATVAQLREELASPTGRPVMAGTSTAGLGATMAQSYLSSADPSLRAMGEQQAQLAWLEALRWCTSR